MAKKPSRIPSFQLGESEKIYFASDFHLGVPDRESSRQRELKIIRWLDQIKPDAKAIFLVGDIFDFWFEYKYSIPKGFVRFQGKLAELRDYGIPIFMLTGNHDMWMSEYFQEELDISVYSEPFSFTVGHRKIFVGHGDGLGPGDYFYKFLKRIFLNRFCQWLFQWIPANIGMGIAHFWSNRSRIASDDREDFHKGENERLLQYSRQVEVTEHHDYYIFGHRHLLFQVEVNANSTYFSLGDWINHYSYLEIDDKEARLKTFNP